LDEAFGTDVPRTKAAFDAMLANGLPRLPASARTFSDAVTAASVELDRTLAALRSASKHPSATLAIADIRVQLDCLFPEDLVVHVPLAMLQQFPRYMRAVQARLGRAIADPRKDLGKLEPFTPIWTSFLAKRASVRDRESLASVRWDLEELRVSLFAPELRTPRPVSVAKVAAALAALD
jgi:ATP-dependent helicase HrpA